MFSKVNSSMNQRQSHVANHWCNVTYRMNQSKIPSTETKSPIMCMSRMCSDISSFEPTILCFCQVFPALAQNCASPSARDRCSLLALWEWKWQRSCAGYSLGLQVVRSDTSDCRDAGRVPADQRPTAGGEKEDENWDPEWTEQEYSKHSHRQDAAHLCAEYPRWIR